MSVIQTLRAFVNQRLAAAVEEIFVLLETTICNYEEEIGRQPRLLVDVVKPETNVSKADVLKLIVRKEGQQEWSSSVDRQDPESPHIKEEQEELCIIQDGEQLQGMEQADITKFPITPVIPVKSEDEDETQSSQLHQRQIEKNREAEPPARSSAQQMETDTDSGQLLSLYCLLLSPDF
eukprot:superscaffoldBa00004982_g19738